MKNNPTKLPWIYGDFCVTWQTLDALCVSFSITFIMSFFPSCLSAGRIHTSQYQSVVGLQRWSSGKPALQPSRFKRRFDRATICFVNNQTFKPEISFLHLTTPKWMCSATGWHHTQWCLKGTDNLFPAGLPESFKDTSSPSNLRLCAHSKTSRIKSWKFDRCRKSKN